MKNANFDFSFPYRNYVQLVLVDLHFRRVQQKKHFNSIYFELITIYYLNNYHFLNYNY